MNVPRRRFLHLAAGVAGLPAVSRIAWAQSYPTRPVRIITGASATISVACLRVVATPAPRRMSN